MDDKAIAMARILLKDDPEALAKLQAAQDALINVNGINLVKSSNVVDDVFEGLTLNLQSADPNKTISVEITEKAGYITSAMTGFVEAYNSVMSLVHAQSKFNPDEDAEALPTAQAPFKNVHRELLSQPCITHSGFNLSNPLIDFVLNAINYRHERAANSRGAAFCSGRVGQPPVMFFDLTHPVRAGLPSCTITDSDHAIRVKSGEVLP